MKNTQLLQEARKHATEILHRCATPKGFRASGLAAGYPQIWARDAAVTALGAAATGDTELFDGIKASLATLGQYQSRNGLIPLNVNPDSGYVSTENAGALDANLWYVLAHYLYWKIAGDIDFLRQSWPTINKALFWLEYQDMNECGLMETPEAGNWMDLIAVRYNILYDNVLYYAAALAHQQMCKHLPPETLCHKLLVDAAGIHERINLLLWIDRCWVGKIKSDPS